MKYKPVMKHRPISEFTLFFFILSLFFSILNLHSKIIFLIILIAFFITRLPGYLKWYRFQSSPKETTEARIIDRRVESTNRRKGETSYTYYLSYQFKDIADKTFTFDEDVFELVYDRVTIGMFTTVKYAITDPRLARRSGRIHPLGEASNRDT